ncbi:hypothetical protein MBGDF03_00561 [Thermoplasmatales archaeon SCGC AB-540-F20]|nr:hypothetical protein MBGDF03_00561 [Thermoplasmatales archaeon SCGC AB-540-F20]
MPGGDGTGPDGQGPVAGRGRGRGQGQGRGLGGGFAQGPDGECRCPNCGHREPHQLGVPCYNKKCPKCGSPMTRA